MEVDPDMPNPGAVLSGTVSHVGVESSLHICEEPESSSDDPDIGLLTDGYHHLAVEDLPTQYDAVIIHSDSDDDAVTANVLKERLNAIHLNSGDQPQVALYSEICPGDAHIVEKLDLVLNQTTLILALMTESLVGEDMDTRQTVYGAFIKFLRNHPERSDCFIPVYLENPKTAKWIPSMIRPCKGLEYKKFDRDLPVIQKTFEFHLSKRKERVRMMKEEASASVTQRA